MDKAALILAIIAELESNLRILVAAANDAKSEATDAENRQEGKFDMRGQSAAYVAEGQSKLAAELTAAIAAYRNLLPVKPPSDGAAAIGKVVTLESQGETAVYFIGPARGGIDVDMGGIRVTVITAHSSLGRQLIGRRAGDSIAAAGPGSGRVHVVARID